jgi:lon-related putative ATP-dependent protease
VDDLCLKPEELRWHCDPNQFEFASTEDLPPLEGTIGQERALSAIDFGIGIRASGFNLFILGQPGTGRTSTIKKILTSHAEKQPVPDDWCYVHDLKDGARPEYIRLPAGMGQELKKDLDHLVERLTEEIPKVFEGKEYEKQKQRITSDYQKKHNNLFQALEQEANAKGFSLQQGASGLVLIPLKDEKPLTQEDYEKLSHAEKAHIEKISTELHKRIKEVMHDVRRLEEEMRAQIADMEKAVLLFAIGHLFEQLEPKYRAFERVIEHFETCKKDLTGRIEELRSQKEPQIAIPGLTPPPQETSFDRYQVNLLIDNSQCKGAPVVYEANPTYFNLFGRIEHIIQMGNATTNFHMIKAGALHRANGGYLILDCREVLFNLFSYEALKRCIRNREVKIEDMAEQFRMIATVTLKPQPIPLDCKIILIGTPLFYYLLFQLDPDFRKYFKVKVDFDQMMKNTWENIQQYALFIGSKCVEEGLRHFDPTAVARTIEYATRLTDDQQRFSARFLDITDLIREAAFYAEREAQELVTAKHVDLAIEARTYRSNKLEERIQDEIDDGSLLIDTEGSMVGQLNGLSVYQLGDYSFGKPSRVTVRSFLGKGGVVNIEREAKLSGPIHDKGVMILGGFFGERYARDKPLALSATICFEQSYGGIEGDSASSTELYGLLSSLADLPIDQGIAVTGSVNQLGMVQPIGGVNEKIEGFYAVCKAKGLTGRQGVIIPDANRKNLMLKQEVINAVENGQFRIWSVTSIDQGIEILTGKPAGERLEDGTWPAGSVNERVDRRLREMIEIARNFQKEADQSDD